jgi:signal transduction histidine kinase
MQTLEAERSTPETDRGRILGRSARTHEACSSGSRTRSEGGAGLGLAICRDIVDRHNGTIVVAPDSEQGATFAVTLSMND